MWCPRCDPGTEILCLRLYFLGDTQAKTGGTRSDSSQWIFRMGFWNWIDRQADGNKDPSAGGKWGKRSPGELQQHNH